ncbi:hypothetical protein D9O40_12320 [Clostridium autoethanogenum]|uniref:Uncharacterized protein n=1 Tax=Clostridium autoethanogenum TaxID=84023 RepID=A0A3M0SLB4_9CLOT|nr:hypothetical protein [Clostridium autoethanogenum]RMC99079.1 hypothetical protein D9O40_12320 [Clostridium autoethanogenum]
MEFRLNKIDPEVNRRVKETTRAGKVHNKSGIFINQDYKDKKNSNQGDFKSELTKYKQGKNKKRIFVEASKIERVEIKAFKEEENISKDDERGSILDVKK